MTIKRNLPTGTIVSGTRWDCAITPPCCFSFSSRTRLTITLGGPLGPAARFSGGGRSRLDQFRGVRYRRQSQANTDPITVVGDVANAPGRPVPVEASSGDERAPCLYSDRREQRLETAAGAGKPNVFRFRRAVRRNTCRERSTAAMCRGPFGDGRPAANRRKQGPHAGPHQGARVNTEPAGP